MPFRRGNASRFAKFVGLQGRLTGRGSLPAGKHIARGADFSGFVLDDFSVCEYNIGKTTAREARRCDGRQAEGPGE